MKIIKTILKVLLMLFILLLVFVFIVFKSGIFTVDIRDYVAAEIMKNTGKDIRIEKIEIGIFNNIVLKNVSIPLRRTFGSDGPFMTLDGIIFRFNILDIFLKKQDIDKTLSHIIIDSPVIYIKRENGRFNVEEFAKSFSFGNGGKKEQGAPLPPLPVNRVLIESGKIKYEDVDAGFATDISNLKGSAAVKMKHGLVRLYLSGRTKYYARRNIKLDLDYYLKSGRFKAGFEVKNADLNHWASYFAPPKDYKIKKGDFSLDINASGSGLSPEKIRTHGTLSIDDGDILIKDSVPVDNIKADVTVIKDKIHINDIEFRAYGGKGIIKGSAGNIFKKLRFDVDLVVDGLDLAEVNGDSLKGKVRATFNAKGGIKKQEIAGNLFWDAGSINSMDVHNVETQVSYTDGMFELAGLSGVVGDGELSGNGKVFIDKKKNMYVRAGLKGLNVSKAAGTEDLTGKLNLGLSLTGKINSPVIKTSVRSKNISCSGNDIENLKSTFTLEGGRISGETGFDYRKYRALTLTADIGFKGGDIDINSVLLRSGEDTLISSKGQYAKNLNTIDIAASIKNIRLSGLEIDFLEGKDVDGIFYGDINVKGPLSAPVITTMVKSDRLVIKKVKHSFSSKIRYEDDAAIVDEFNFNGALTGAGEFSVKKKIFNINGEIKKFRGFVLQELTGLDIFKNSLIEGSLLVKKEKDGYGGNVMIDVNYNKGIYKGINIDITGEKNEFVINKLFIRQKKGFLRVGGMCSVKKDDVLFLTNGKIKDYRVNKKLRVTGDFYHDSKITLGEKISTTSTRMKFIKMFFNNNKQEDLDISFKTINTSVPELKIKWGSAYDIDAKIFNGKIPKVDIEARLKDADLYPVYTLLNHRDKGLPEESKINADIKLKGEINNSLLTASIGQKDGALNLHGDISVIKNKGEYRPARINIKYKSSDLSISDFALIFNEKFEHSGTLSGEGKVRGRLDNIESDGILSLEEGVLAGFKYNKVGLDYRVKDRKILIDKFRLDYKNTYVMVEDSAVEIKDEGDYYVTVKSQLKDFVWRGNWLNGGVNFYGRINNFRHLLIDGSISSENFGFKYHRFSPFLIKINYSREGLKLKTRKGKNNIDADIRFADGLIMMKKFFIENEEGEKYLTIKGDINTGKGNSTMAVESTGLDPQIINDLMGWDHKWGGELRGNVRLSGNPDSGLKYTIYVTINNGMVDGIPYDILSGLLTLKDHWLDFSPVDPMVMVKEDKYYVELTGKIPVPMSEQGVEILRGKEMDLHFSMKDGDLSIANFLKWIDTAEGLTNLDLDIRGTKEFPSVSGTVTITDGTARLRYLFKEIKSIYGNMVIKDNVMDIYNLKGDTERGTLKITNLDDKKKGGIMKSFKPYEVNWKITNIGDKIRFTDTYWLEFLNGDADIDLEVTGLFLAPHVKGALKVSDLRYKYPITYRTFEGEEVNKLKKNYAKMITWDIEAYVEDNVYYYNDKFSSYGNYAKVFLKLGDTPLVIKDKGKDLKIYGNVYVTKGEYKYLNTELNHDEMKQSKAVFDGLTKPVLDIHAKTKLKRFELNKVLGSGTDLAGVSRSMDISGPVDLEVFVSALGRIGETRIEVKSDPPLERNRLLYILTFGRDIDPEKGIDDEDVRKMADAIANSWIKQGTEQIEKLVPWFDDIVVKVGDLLPKEQETPEPGSGTNTVTARTKTKVQIGMGKYLTDQLYFDYNLRLMEHELDPGIYNLEQELGFEFSLDEVNKLIMKGIFRDPSQPYIPESEFFMGIETRLSFETWGAKPKVTPTPEE